MGNSYLKTILAFISAITIVTKTDIAVSAEQNTSSEQAPKIEEIIVMARKKAENKRDIPVSLQTLSGAQLTDAKISQIADLTARMPTLTIALGSNNPTVEIRGFGTGNNLSFDQAVGKFIDNVSYGRDQDARLPLFDLEGVEVLKGPQIMLYGNSSTAGALNITTRKPGNELTGDVSAAYEFNAHEVVTQGGLTVPIAPDKASLRVSGFYQNLEKGGVYNTSIDSYGPKDRNYAGRAILRLTPTSNLEILLKAEYDHVRQYGNGIEVTTQQLFLPPLSQDATLDGRNESNSNVPPFFQTASNKLNNQTYQMDINLQAFGGTITSTTAYRDSETGLSTPAATLAPILNAYVGVNYKQTSQELRYTGEFDKIDVIFGGFYQYESLLNATAIDTNAAAAGIPAPPFSFNFLLREKTYSASAFSAVTYHFTEQFNLELGTRYSSIKRDASQSAFPGTINPDKVLGAGAANLARNDAYDPLFFGFFGVLPHDFTGLHLSETHFQPQITAQYKINSNNQIYANYVKGDKAGGFDANYQGGPGVGTPEGHIFHPKKPKHTKLALRDWHSMTG